MDFKAKRAFLRDGMFALGVGVTSDVSKVFKMCFSPHLSHCIPHVVHIDVLKFIPTSEHLRLSDE